MKCCRKLSWYKKKKLAKMIKQLGVKSQSGQEPELYDTFGRRVK